MMDLSFTNSSNLHDVLSTLPEEFTFNVLRIDKSYLLDLTVNDFPPHSTGLTELRIFNNEGIDDDIIDMFYNWALQFSKDSLVKFYLYDNGLKKIPSALWRFNGLAYFRIDGNILEPGIVKTGDLKLTDHTQIVQLSHCGIHTIEAGAFQGNLKIKIK